MRNFLIGAILAAIAGVAAGATPGASPADTFPTPSGPLTLTFLGHGTLRLSLGAVEVYVDPVSRYGNFAAMPKADLVLVTHQHGDHLDPAAIEALRKPGTVVVATQACAEKLPGATVLANGQSGAWAGVRVEAAPAYNLEHKRPDGTPFHPRGEGNGYVLTLGGKRIYVAGDTENIPEMASLKDIDIAFLPMNLPYTMTPEMVAAAARAIRPKVLYPYHYGDTDPQKLVELLKDLPAVEVRVRDLR
jgi:L-ascorbate metabolism protein UlaG (beta-lactamase superfamily)